MKKSTKAGLLSALVLPGFGHLYLKLYIQGIILSLVAGSAVFHIMSVAVSSAIRTVEKLQNGNMLIDVQTISELASQQATTNVESTNLAVIVLVICWLMGIIDAYRQGDKQEQK